MSAETLNLLPPNRRRELRLHRRLHVWMVLGAAYGIATIGACITLAAGEPVIDRHETTELTALTREADVLKEETSQHKKNIAAENRRKQGADLVKDHPDWSTLLELLAQTRGDEIVLESLDVKPVEGVSVAAMPTAPPASNDAKADAKPTGKPAHPVAYDVRLTGFAKTQTAVTDFADRLQKCNVFDLVKLERSSARASGGLPVIDYTILCHLGTSPAATEQEARP